MIANIVGGESHGLAIKVPDDTLHYLIAKKPPIDCVPWVSGKVPEMAIPPEAYSLQRWHKGREEFCFLVLDGMPAIEANTIIYRAIEAA